MADTIVWIKAIGTVLGAILCILSVMFLVGDFALPELWLVSGVWLLLYRFVAKIDNKWVRVAVEMSTAVSCGCSLSLFKSTMPVWPLAQAPLLLLIGLFSICTPQFAGFLGSLPVGGFIGALVWQLNLSTTVPLWLHGWMVGFVALLCAVVFACTPVMAAIEAMIMPSLGVLLILMSLGTLAPSTGFVTPDLLLEVSRADGAKNIAVFWGGISSVFVALHLLMLSVSSPREEKQQNVKLSTKLMPEGGDAERGNGMNLPAKDSGIQRLPALTVAICNENADLSGFTENERKLIMICREDEEERNRILWGGGLY